MATPELSPENSKKKPGLKQVLIPVAAIIASVVTALIFIKTGAFSSHPPAVGFESVAVGKVIEDFEVESLSGEKRKVSDFKSKVLIVNFWATWCGPCIREMPSLDRLVKEYKTRGLDILAINVDEDPKGKVQKFMEKYNFGFPTYLDAEGKISERLGVEGLPYTIVLDSDRKVIFNHLGDEDWFSRENRESFEKWLGIEAT